MCDLEQKVNCTTSSEDLYSRLNEAIDRARQRLLDNASLSPSSSEEANVLLDLAEDAHKKMKFDRAYRHYEKALLVLWAFA